MPWKWKHFGFDSYFSSSFTCSFSDFYGEIKVMSLKSWLQGLPKESKKSKCCNSPQNTVPAGKPFELRGTNYLRNSTAPLTLRNSAPRDAGERSHFQHSHFTSGNRESSHSHWEKSRNCRKEASFELKKKNKKERKIREGGKEKTGGRGEGGQHYPAEDGEFNYFKTTFRS